MGKNVSLSTEIIRYAHISDLLDPTITDLCEKAIEAIQSAYAPYSNYPVGVALHMTDGTIVQGSNQENAVYPLGLCAERVGIYSATSANPGVGISALAVATKKVLSEDELPPFPCGSCRQVMLEMENRYQQDIQLYVIGSDKSVCVVNGIRQLLPFSFDQASL